MKMKLTILFLIAGAALFLSSAQAQYFFVLPLPYPIDYLEQVPETEEAEIEREESIEEAPATEFSPLVPPDFKIQKALGYEQGVTFKIPEGLKDKVEFWKKIYRHYSVDQYILHDSRYNLIIYQAIDIGDINRRKLSYKASRKLVAQRLREGKHEIRILLNSIHKKQHDLSTMSEEERRIYNLFQNIDSPNKFLKATREIRSQLGQKERFEQGLIWAGRYLRWMEKIFQEEGIPMELTRIPFVESSFNIKARSKVGASGIWQFMRSTGTRYMSVNAALDERNDPIEATRSAAKLLKTNYHLLQSWPLAVTAYNHGASGMKRAVKKVGSIDLVGIIREYRSRTFGFASKNFYAEFLAALETELEYEKYFGSLSIEAQMTFDEADIKSYVSIPALIQYTELSKQILKRYNPALTNYVFSGKKFIPPGYKLKLPQGMKESFLEAYNNIPQERKSSRQKQFTYHRVRRGDTLIYLARLYETTVGEIKRANRIGRVLYAGQVLVIPK